MKRRALLATAAAVALAGCNEGTLEEDTEAEDGPPKNYSRYVDCEAGVVIYEQNSGEGGFETVPIEDTNLHFNEECGNE